MGEENAKLASWKGSVSDQSCAFFGKIVTAEALELYVTVVPPTMPVQNFAGWITKEGGISVTASCLTTNETGEQEECVDPVQLKLSDDNLKVLLEDFRARSAGSVPYVIYNLNKTRIFNNDRLWQQIIDDDVSKPKIQKKSLLFVMCENFDKAANELGAHIKEDVGTKADKCGLITGICLVPTLCFALICAKRYVIDYEFMKCDWPSVIDVTTAEMVEEEKE